MSDRPLLNISDLHVSFQSETGLVDAVSGVSLELYPGETLGLVGESGCGKSVTAMSVLRLLPQPAGKIVGGQVLFEGSDLLKQPLDVMRGIRGRRIGMIFQEPMAALNPVQTIGAQLLEVFQLHMPEMSATQSVKRGIELLERVGIPEAEQRLKEYPHQLSGGMRQRVMIAMALAGEPDVLIADEPTTALDVTIQAQILNLIADIQKETGMAMIFITHDLGVVAAICQRIAVMYAGQIVELAARDDFFRNPRHPYSQGLLHSLPGMDGAPKQPLPAIEGQVPPSSQWGSGCRFVNRCFAANASCAENAQVLSEISTGIQVRCERWQEVSN